MAQKKKRASTRTSRSRAAGTGALRAHPVGYYRQPTIHGDTIVFVSEDDLWVVHREGGVARRLTAGGGVASSPRFSPDGSQIAFTATYDGPPDAYVMDAEGGEPRRISFFGSMQRVVGWSADGKRVRVSTSVAQPFLGMFWLHDVPVDGSPTKRFEWGPVREIAEQPGAGKGVTLGINSGDIARWKRYKGGTRGRLLVDRTGNGTFAPLFETEGNVSSPMWIGKRIFFLSDREGHGNLYSCNASGKDMQRHSDHEGLFARFASTDGKCIVYHVGADLWVYDVATDKTAAIDVRVKSPRTGRMRKFVGAPSRLESVALHPNGHSLALVSRGGVYTMPLWEGAPQRFGTVSTSRYRLARYLPDGERLVAVSDEGGEEALVVFNGVDAKGKHLTGDIGRVLSLDVAPKGAARVVVTNHRQEVLLCKLSGGKPTKIDSSKFDRIRGCSWSHDGRWFAYAIPVSRTGAVIRVYDTKENKRHDLTAEDFNDFAPTFDPTGQYLYFLSSRDFDPVYDNQYFDLGFPKGVRAFALPLRKDVMSPFSTAAKTPRAPGEDWKPAEAPTSLKIDIAGAASRVLAFPTPEGKYFDIAATKKGVFLLSVPPVGSLSSEGDESPQGTLQVFGFQDQKLETYRDKMTAFTLSMNGRTLLMKSRGKVRVASATAEPKDLSSKTNHARETGWVDLARIRVEVDPAAEWKQMFHEAWRLQRDHYWTPDMSGIDWKAVLTRYNPLVDRVATRSEFSDLMWEMQGELGTSHAYEMGGDYAPGNRWYQGFLGADLAYDRQAKGWRIQRMPEGDSWVLKATSPLGAPGLAIRERDLITAVGGVAVDAKTSPASLLVNEAGRNVVLTIKSGARKARQVIVSTLRSEQKLRYRDMVEANRAAVHKASKGKVGYVHVPNMGPWGYSEFHRYYATEVERDGLIVDVRNNGGGHVSQLLLEKLLRKRVGFDTTRWMGRAPYPDNAPRGALVAITNEYAGSDGDIFSHSFKLYNLGPLVGRRTWGGVVGIWPRHALVDGTVTTQPEFAYWFNDVGYTVENYGTDPDVPADNLPQHYAKGVDNQLNVAMQEMNKLLPKLKPEPDPKTWPSMKAPKLPKKRK